jgi:Ca2+/H+ antiporter, TMEM165/GDT1 family
MRRLSRPIRFLLFIPLIAIGVFVFGEVVMILWNGVLTPVLNVHTVTFWQGLGILALSKVLFSSFNGRGRSRGDYWKQRMMWTQMTPEQKEKFKEEWKCRSRRWGYKNWEQGDETRQPESQV